MNAQSLSLPFFLVKIYVSFSEKEASSFKETSSSDDFEKEIIIHINFLHSGKFEMIQRVERTLNHFCARKLLEIGT